MKSKTFVLAVFLLALSLPAGLRAQQAAPKEVSSLLADYRKEYGKAKEASDKVLRTEAAKIATKLVTEGNADAATTISTQVEDKIAGKAVTTTDAALTNLFTRYDSAVTAIAKPIRDKFTGRVDALLRGNMSKDLSAVAALGEAKKIILGELPAFDAPTDPKVGGSMVTNPARGRKVIGDLAEGKTWAFQTSTGEQLIGFDKRGNKARWLRTGGKAGPAVSEYSWTAEDDYILLGTDMCEVRFDVSGSFGEVVFLSTKNRYRLEPSTKTIPAK